MWDIGTSEAPDVPALRTGPKETGRSAIFAKILSGGLLACRCGITLVATVVVGRLLFAVGARSSQKSILRSILVCSNVPNRGILQVGAVFAAVIEFAGSKAVLEPQSRQT